MPSSRLRVTAAIGAVALGLAVPGLHIDVDSRAFAADLQTDAAPPAAPAVTPNAAPAAPAVTPDPAMTAPTVVPNAAPAAPAVAPTPAAPNAAPQPSPPDAANPPDLPVAWGANGAKNLLYRSLAVPMGDNNAVRFWLRGDGSGAVLRVRVFTIDDNVDTDQAMLRPMWISRPVKVNFTGWREILLPRSRFALRNRNAAPDGIDPALPADVQPVTPKWASVAPRWSAVNAIALETNVSNTASLVVDDIAWATLSPDGRAVSGVTVADMESGDIASWKSVGPDEQQHTLVYGVSAKAGYAHGGRIGLKLDITSPGVLRRKVLLPAANKLMAASGKPFLIFVPKSPFTPIRRTSLPEQGGASSHVSVQMCADQTQPATFCLYSQKWMRNITVQVADDLRGGGRRIPKSAVDLRVVKFWNQDGYGPLRDPDQAGLIAKFLVKDDRVKLGGVAPDVRLTGDVATDMAPDTTKQFWITVRLPADTVPGHYTGRILLSMSDGPVATVPLDVEVLPIRLMSPAKEYVINLRSRVDDAPAALPSADGQDLVTDFVNRDMLDKQLADIADHGVHKVTVRGTDPSVWDVLPDYKSAGFRPPYVYTGPSDPAQMEAARAAHGAPDFLYFARPADDEAQKLAALAKQGLQTTAYVAHQDDFAALADNLPYVIYDRDSEYPQQLIRTHGQRTSAKHDWWYWQAASEDCVSNRLTAGWLLTRSKLYGGFIADYQASFGTDPYDEMSTGAPGQLSSFRPQMLTYPAKDGVIDTLQWEAVREGVNDTRYLTTFYSALRECKDNHVAKDVVAEAEAYATSFLDKPLTLLSDEDYQQARQKIAQYAVKLRMAVDAYYKAHPAQ